MGAGQETNGVAQSALSKESEYPFSCGRKTGLCSSFFPYKPQGARVAIVQMSPDWEGQRLLGLFR